MSDVPDEIMTDESQLRLIDRVAVLISLSIAGVLFFFVGWSGMAPDDPQGPISVLSRRSGGTMLLLACGLAIVSSAIATHLAGRRLLDVGTFAAAVGLAAVSLRGSTSAELLLLGEETVASYERTLAWKFALESVGWFLVLMTAVVVSGWVMRRWGGRNGQTPSSGSHFPALMGFLPAAYDAHTLSQRHLGASKDYQTSPRDGLMYAALTAILGMALLRVLSNGLTVREILPGQVCFVVGGSVYLALYIAGRIVLVRSTLWGILGVGLMGVVCYLWSVIRPEGPALPPGIPSSPYLRILPIQFMSVGVATVIFAFWNSMPYYENLPDHQQPSSQIK